MMWVEIVSRSREVVARHRLAGPEAFIGRGYDNDVILDDPYVAARHLRLFRDELGQLVAEDLGSINGMFLAGDRKRQARVNINDQVLVRIGRTALRIRELSYAVGPERAVSSTRSLLLVALALAGSALLLGIEYLNAWLTPIADPNPLSYLTPLLFLASSVLLWVGFWVLLARVFSGSAHFLENLLIALGCTLAYQLYSHFAKFSAFSLNSPGAASLGYIAGWSLLAVACFFHLGKVGLRARLRAGIVVVLLALILGFQTLQRSEAYAASGRQNAVYPLLPPTFRLVPAHDEGIFFGNIATLKADLDAPRAEAERGIGGR